MRHRLCSLIVQVALFAMPVYSQQVPGTSPVQDQPDNAALMQKIRDLEDRLQTADGIQRRLASRRYAAGVALETLKRVFAARLNAGAMRHEIGTAGSANGRNLFGRGLLGKRRCKPGAT